MGGCMVGTVQASLTRRRACGGRTIHGLNAHGYHPQSVRDKASIRCPHGKRRLSAAATRQDIAEHQTRANALAPRFTWT